MRLLVLTAITAMCLCTSLDDIAASIRLPPGGAAAGRVSLQRLLGVALRQGPLRQVHGPLRQRHPLRRKLQLPRDPPPPFSLTPPLSKGIEGENPELTHVFAVVDSNGDGVADVVRNVTGPLWVPNGIALHGDEYPPPPQRHPPPHPTPPPTPPASSSRRSTAFGNSPAPSPPPSPGPPPPLPRTSWRRGRSQTGRGTGGGTCARAPTRNCIWPLGRRATSPGTRTRRASTRRGGGGGGLGLLLEWALTDPAWRRSRLVLFIALFLLLFIYLLFTYYLPIIYLLFINNFLIFSLSYHLVTNYLNYLSSSHPHPPPPPPPGIRNSVGMTFHPLTGDLLFTDNGRDNWDPDHSKRPPDELNTLSTKNSTGGWGAL
jgi:hypothetical protein